MANNIFTFYIRGRGGTYFPVYLTDQYTCDLEESYIGNLLTIGDLWQNKDIGNASYRKHWEITSYTNPTYNHLLGMYIVDEVEQDGMCVCYSGNTNDVKWAGGIGNLTTAPSRSSSEYLCQRYEGWFTTNVPIFDTQEHANAYMESDDVAIRQNLIRTYAVNYASTTPIPAENPNKYISAQLNLMRRRLLQFVLPPAYENFFNYTIADGYAWVTSVKRDEWLDKFGNLDIYVPDELEGYPTVIVAQVYDWD